MYSGCQGARFPHPIPLGYRAPHRVTKALKKFVRPSLFLTLSVVFGDHILLCIAAGLGHWLMFSGHPVISSLVHPLIWYFCALRLRGFEALLHEASHFSWTKRRYLNDVLANFLVALPVFATVAGFRHNHILHHVRFGTILDTDKMWLDGIRAEDIDRSSPKSFLGDLIARLGQYHLIYWRTVSSSRSALLYSIAWHGIVILALTVPLGFEEALLVWVTYYLVPFVLFLPPIRLLVESGEHVYRDSTTVFEASVNTKSTLLRWLLYPHGDSYHALHHLVPSIPHHSLKRAHDYLCDTDPSGYGQHQRYRLGILCQPTKIPTACHRPSIA